MNLSKNWPISSSVSYRDSCMISSRMYQIMIVLFIPWRLSLKSSVIICRIISLCRLLSSISIIFCIRMRRFGRIRVPSLEMKKRSWIMNQERCLIIVTRRIWIIELMIWRWILRIWRSWSCLLLTSICICKMSARWRLFISLMLSLQRKGRRLL